MTCYLRSQDEEIDLVPLEEFLRDAPESLSAKKSVGGIPLNFYIFNGVCVGFYLVTFDLFKGKEHDAHQLQKARLEWELQQRRQLAELCNQMQSQKESVAKDIEKQQQHLDNLTPMLRNILLVRYYVLLF